MGTRKPPVRELSDTLRGAGRREEVLQEDVT